MTQRASSILYDNDNINNKNNSNNDWLVGWMDIIVINVGFKYIIYSIRVD